MRASSSEGNRCAAYDPAGQLLFRTGSADVQRGRRDERARRSRQLSWVGREEIAEAAAKLLASDLPLLGTFAMTGPSPLSLNETAALVSSLKQRTLRYEDEPVDAAKEWRSKLGVPAWEVDTWVGSYEAIAAGEFEPVDPALATILGRPVSDLKSYLALRPAL
jgi:NAD(P)H dehydrogenase (quinone)